uniref:H1.7 linker histone n=1 Tax=Rhinolophus ferrumequinum TaxID=59479 RepID=A0A671EEA3_RHIFE
NEQDLSGQRKGMGGSWAMAEVAEPSGESQGAEVKTQQPTERFLGRPPRRNLRSVLRVSQVLLRAITEHGRLTLSALKKELGNAGYQVRRKCCRHSSEAPKSDIKGTLIRVSGNDAGYFRVCKIPKPKRKFGRPRLEVGVRSRKRSPAGPRGPRKPRVRRRATKKAREVRGRRRARANATVRRIRPRAKDPVRSRAKEEKRAKVMDERRGRTTKEDRSRTRKEKKPKEEKHDPEKPVKRTRQRSASVKTVPRAACTKTCTKSENPQNPASGNL